MVANRFRNAVKGVWHFFRHPSPKWPLGVILLAGIGVGALAFGG